MTPPRVVLYGHDTLGLGHVRRNLALAEAMSQASVRPDVLVVTGAIEAAAFDLPAGVDVLTVPGVRKDDAGHYAARRLGAGIDAVLSVRGAAIAAGVDAFDPDVIVIDKVPHGLRGELRPLLDRLSSRPRVVLGLRDVLDAPAAAGEEWRLARTNDALRTFVDEVWVYGDRSVHDLGDACGVPPALRQRMRYLGYLSTGRIARPERPPGVDARTRFALCTVGGGQDGAFIATAFAATSWPAGVVGVIVTGPQMPAAEQAAVRRAAADRHDLIVVDLHAHVDRWIAAAGAVVAMGGYNTVAEVLATSTPALVVPRVRPRAEQAVRVEALCRRRLLDHLDGTDVTPAALSRWLHDALARHRAPRAGVDLDGLAAVTRRTESLLGQDDALAI